MAEWPGPGQVAGWLRVLVLSMLAGPGGEAATRTRRTQSKSNKPQLCQIHISVTVSMHTCPHLLTRYSNCSNDISFVSVGCPFFGAILHLLKFSKSILRQEDRRRLYKLRQYQHDRRQRHCVTKCLK